MENTFTVIVTAGITLVITVLAGIIVEYIKKRKAKLLYLIQTSIPIEQDNKHISANIIYIENHSSKTVSNIIMKLTTNTGTIKNAGIKTTTGLEYETKEKDSYLSISIPFLKAKEHMSITTVMEGQYSVPDKPELTIRSPDAFTLENLENKNNNVSTNWILPTIVSIAVVTLALSFFTKFSLARSSQGTNLELAAAFIGLPEVANSYISNEGITYYNQAPYIYSLAQATKDKDMIEKYKHFLIKLIEISDGMASVSKSAIYFFIGKISQLQNNNKEAKEWFQKSNDLDKKEYLYLSNIFDIKDL